jgi:hypothetical protein
MSQHTALTADEQKVNKCSEENLRTEFNRMD